MIVPGIFTLDTAFAPAGQGVEKGVQVPGTRSYRNAQFMTPETRSSTHFFWNYLHDFDIDNPNIALSLRHSLEEGFNEDKDIIEAQQKVFDADPNTQLLAIGADAPLTYFRWLFSRKIEAERSAVKARIGPTTSPSRRFSSFASPANAPANRNRPVGRGSPTVVVTKPARALCASLPSALGFTGPDPLRSSVWRGHATRNASSKASRREKI